MKLGLSSRRDWSSSGVGSTPPDEHQGPKSKTVENHLNTNHFHMIYLTVGIYLYKKLGMGSLFAHFFSLVFSYHAR
jgi:hypothetical protein